MNRKSIPEGILMEDVAELKGVLRAILEKIGARNVDILLNSTERSPRILFICSVSSVKAENISNHFGEDFSKTKVYREVFSNPGTIANRNWTSPPKETRMSARILAEEAGLKYLQFSALIAGHDLKIAAGILTVGFAKMPEEKTIKESERALKYWAQSEESELVKLIDQRYEFVGPPA